MEIADTGTAEQMTLAGVPGPRARRGARPAGPVAEHLAVAHVVVDRPQPHLDRAFEYVVPQALADAAQPGVRVKVRFGGQDLDGYVVGRSETAEHEGSLTPLRRVVSPERVLAPEVRELAQAVASRYAGTLSDVLRLAVPPRHARVEQESWHVDPGVTNAPLAAGDPASPAPDGSAPATAGQRVWDECTGGAAFLRRINAGHDPRAVWQALPGIPGPSWADAVATAVLAARSGGRGALVVVPSAGEVTSVTDALLRAGTPAWTPGAAGGWVRLMADDGPAARYRAFLAALRGAADVVVGTRAASFAPVRALGLVVCWDDANHLHAEPRAPYPHAREVLAMRAEQAGSAVLVGGFVRSAATQRGVSTGWAHPLSAPREVVRRSTPRVSALTSVELASEGPAAGARLPAPAWRAVRDGLVRGPVLVQVPRAGYVPSVACQRCRTVARCTGCSGPLHLASPGSPPQCRWCGRLAGDWRCPECSWTALRSLQVGSHRTAEELGRAFPGVPVRVSGASAAGGVLATVGPEPALVIATPGAEPVAEGGYAAALLLDAALVTSRVALDVGEQALRTWLCAAALVRPAPHGVVLLVGDAAPAPTQALVRWDPAGFADRELTERTELQLPPSVHLVALEGPRDAVEAFVQRLELPAVSSVLGPLTLDERHGVPGSQAAAPAPALTLDPESRRPVRALVRSPWGVAAEVLAELTRVQVVRSARRETPVRLQAEPLDVS